MTSESSMAGVVAGSWKWILSFGIVLILVGIVAIANPFATVIATSLLFAIGLLVAGSFSLAAGITAKGASGRLAEIFFGILALVSSCLVFVSPVEGALSLVWALGALYTISGVLELVSAVLRRSAHRWGVILLGIADILIGLWVLFLLPGTALIALAFVVGISFIIRGAFLSAIGLRLKALAAS